MTIFMIGPALIGRERHASIESKSISAAVTNVGR